MKAWHFTALLAQCCVMMEGFFKTGFGNDTTRSGKQKMCPSASGSPQPTRDTPWTPVTWPVVLGEVTLHSQVFYFSANKGWSGGLSLVPPLRSIWGGWEVPRDKHIGRPVPPPPPPSTALVSVTSLWNVKTSMGFRQITLEKLGPGNNTRLARHTCYGHLTSDTSSRIGVWGDAVVLVTLTKVGG